MDGALVMPLIVSLIRELKETTSASATRTPQTINRSIAVHVRYNSLYISLPSSAKQQQVLRIFENANDGGYFFVFSFGIDRWGGIKMHGLCGNANPNATAASLTAKMSSFV